MTTHYLEEADELADRLSIMEHGKIVAEGTPRKLKQQIAGDVIVIKPKHNGSEIHKIQQYLDNQPFVREAHVEGEALHRGQITKILIDGNKAVIGIMVEGKVESDTLYDKAKVSIDNGTKIFKENSSQKLSGSELKEGMKVEVVFEGPVAESYPVQGKAKTIRVID